MVIDPLLIQESTVTLAESPRGAIVAEASLESGEGIRVYLLYRDPAEASMKTQAVKKFVEENQKLATECASLLGQCERLEKECALYDKDHEAVTEFGNEADVLAKKAEARV